MAKIILEEQPEFAVLPAESILHLKVEEVSVKDVDGRNGSWQKLEFKFKILGIQAIGDGGQPEDYESLITQHIWGSVPFRLTDSAENKLRLWAESILQMELGVGFELDTELFLRREVRGITSTYNKRATDPRTGQPFKAHQVESLLPKGGSPQAQQQNPWTQQQQPTQQPAQESPWVTSGAPATSSTWEDPPF